MNAERCLYCTAIIPEGRQVCPNCEDWLIMRKAGKNALAAHGYDGGSMTIADVMQEMGISSYTDALKIMRAFGSKVGKRMVIGRREFMYRKANGDIDAALSVPLPKNQNIEKAIKMLELCGYRVTKEAP